MGQAQPHADLVSRAMVSNTFDKTTGAFGSDSRCHHCCSAFLSRLAPELITVAFFASVAASWFVHLTMHT